MTWVRYALAEAYANDVPYDVLIEAAETEDASKFADHLNSAILQVEEGKRHG